MEKKKEKRGERKERGENKERKGEESKREECIRPMGVKHPLGTIQRLLKTQKDGGWKKAKKARREEEETEKAGENMVTKDRLICENIGSVLYSNIYPYHHSWTFCQFYSSCQKRGYHLNCDPFFVSEYYRKVCTKSRKLGLKIAKFS